MNFPIYMDHHATTPLDPRVLEAMMLYLTTEFGNASSSSHPFGWHAEKAVEASRAEIARFINAHPKEIVFTSGATESNNMVLKGVAEMYHEKGDHIITQVTEHKCILDTCKYLEKKGIKTTFLGVDNTGRVRLEDLKKAITGKTILISIMVANNEVGTIQPIAEIGKIAKERGILFHVDAAQAAGKIPMDVEAMGIDLLCISAHKMYGPKGTGVLYVRHQNPRVRLVPLLHGGGQEHAMRSGTLNVPGIVGFAKACEIARKETREESKRVAELRDRLEYGLQKELDYVFVNGHPIDRLYNNLNMSFLYIEGESLITAINGEIAVSTGSACTSGSKDPSYVLKAMGLPGDRMHSSVRFGLGRFNTIEEVDYVIDRVVMNVKKLRQLSALYPGPGTAVEK
ncbi:MAG TPA: IscS subfamily cysteine desulfurase [bacterium]|nr:IscS subfamily cysteine desulfurase [bacterium]